MKNLDDELVKSIYRGYYKRAKQHILDGASVAVETPSAFCPHEKAIPILSAVVQSMMIDFVEQRKRFPYTNELALCALLMEKGADIKGEFEFVRRNGAVMKALPLHGFALVGALDLAKKYIIRHPDFFISTNGSSALHLARQGKDILEEAGVEENHENYNRLEKLLENPYPFFRQHQEELGPSNMLGIRAKEASPAEEASETNKTKSKALFSRL